MLDRLKEMGDPLTAPRHTLLFFYRRDGAEQYSFQTIVASAAEWSLTRAGGDEGGLILEGQLYVDPAALAPLLEWAAEAAEMASVEFDGWECAVVHTRQ